MVPVHPGVSHGSYMRWVNARPEDYHFFFYDTHSHLCVFLLYILESSTGAFLFVTMFVLCPYTSTEVYEKCIKKKKHEYGDTGV